MLTPTVENVMREVRDAKERLKPYLVKRAEVIRHMAGNHYRSDEKGAPSPENYPFSYKAFVLPQLMFGQPAPTVKANSPIYAETASALQTAMDYWSKETGWANTLEQIISDCFAGFGISKAGISPVGRHVGAAGLEAVEGNFQEVPNYPFIVRVDPRNFIIDARADSIDEARILGETYEQDLADVQADWRNDQEAVSKLDQVVREDVTKSEISPFKHPATRQAERKRVVLHEVYLREHGLLMTIGETGDDSGVILRQEQYWGPEDGPYTLWGLDTIPGELVPISPLVALWDEYLEVQQHSKVVARSASTYKMLGLYTPGSSDDAERINNAENGEMVCAKDPGAVKTVEIGGASDGQISFVEYVRNRFQNALGYGQAQQGIAGSKTATGESIANSNSDLRIDRMRGRVGRSAADAYKKPCWYFFHDNTIDRIQTTYTDPSTGQQLPATFQPGPWQGGFIENHWVPPELPSDFSEYNLDVDPESMTKGDDALEQQQGQNLLVLAQQDISMGIPVNYRWVLDVYGQRVLGIKDFSNQYLLDQGTVIPMNPMAQGQTPLGPTPGAKPLSGMGSPQTRGASTIGRGDNPRMGMSAKPQMAGPGSMQRTAPQMAGAMRPAMAMAG